MITFALLTIGMQGHTGLTRDVQQLLHGKYWIEATRSDLPDLETGFKYLMKVDNKSLRKLIEAYLKPAKPLPKNTLDPAFREGQIEYSRRAMNIGVLNRLKFNAAAKKHKLKDQWFGPAPELNTQTIWKLTKGSWKLQVNNAGFGGGPALFDALAEFDWLVKKAAG